MKATLTLSEKDTQEAIRGYYEAQGYRVIGVNVHPVSRLVGMGPSERYAPALEVSVDVEAQPAVNRPPSSGSSFDQTQGISSQFGGEGGR